MKAEDNNVRTYSIQAILNIEAASELIGNLETLDKEVKEAFQERLGNASEFLNKIVENK